MAEATLPPTASTGRPVRLAPRRSEWGRARTSLLHNRLALVSGAILIVVLLGAIFAPVLAPHDPNDVDVLNVLRAPSLAGAYPLGTDRLGQDILSRILHGARISLFVSGVALAISTVLGVTLGLMAGYFGGVVDDVLMTLADMELAFPSILLYIAALTVLGPGLLNIILVLGIARWVPYGRVVRAEVLALREKEFVLAARAVGGGARWIILRHLLPNLVAPVIVVASFGLSTNIIVESSLSFLGLGVPVSVPTWGSMLNDGREALRIAWWPATMPGLAIMFTVLGVNALGDWLRDFLDPRLQGEQ
jgi:peptide/nickel transport system permease protein